MYNANIYQKAKETIANRRQTALSVAEARNMELRALSPEINEIDSELTKTGLELFRVACAGENITPLRERNQKLCERRRELIVKLGLPADYTEVHYTCKKCSDTGYEGTSICSCLRNMLVYENMKNSGMGNLLERQSFENFDVNRYRKTGTECFKRMLLNFERAKRYAEMFPYKKGNLLLIGTTGSGKTHISTAIANVVIHQGFTVLYDSAQNIIDAFNDDHFHNGYGQNEPKSAKFTECDLLIIDDLGTEFITPFGVSCLYTLLNTRQNRGLATIISTNLSDKELKERYADRIYSRVLGSDYQILAFVGDDYRLCR